ncbi:MAG: hypothetical protein NC251_04260 [Lachnoclostridium sp.]|nr:hypothetical protein [Lachnospira sp.]MCM1247626.1 hypothetical protein [Lachnoclostridium sp.]
MDLRKELLKSMQIMIDRKLNNYKADRTYQSIIKRITPNGYVVLDSAGSERTVPCSIPGLALRAGQSVWVKEPMEDLKGLHIVGVSAFNKCPENKKEGGELSGKADHTKDSTF